MSAIKELENGRKTATASDFVGTWRLTDYVFLYEDGTVAKPWGENVVGFLLYSPEGYMCGNLSPAGRRHNVERTGVQKAHCKRDYIAYAGPYTVEGDTVAHHVEVSLFANWLETAQLRYYKLEGDRLTLRTPPILSSNCLVVAQLTWRRIGSWSCERDENGGQPTWLP
jgi:hypothetical protein